MSKLRYGVTLGLALALIASMSPALARVKTVKVKPYTAEITQDFTNTESTPAHGLVVALSAEGVVKVDEETRAAGPFRNVRGNGTSQITLTNPTQPIDAAGGANASLELVFQSYKGKLSIKSWWWLDAKGKRLGKKQKGS